MVSKRRNSPNPDGELSPLTDPLHWPALIEGVRPEAFLVLIAMHMGWRMREYCEPEDIWQETLARAWSAREAHHWRGSAAFRAWLLEIAIAFIHAERRRNAGPMRNGPAQISMLHSNTTHKERGELVPGIALGSAH